MSLLKILQFPNPRLRNKAHVVKHVDKEIQRLMDDMLETMYNAKGCGLAATQVGVELRVIVMDLNVDEYEGGVYKMANPEVIWKSKKMSSYEEGCLSVLGERAEIFRPSMVTVRYLDEKGNVCEKKGDDLFATCVQHEIDHLDGKLFIDYISSKEVNISHAALK